MLYGHWEIMTSTGKMFFGLFQSSNDLDSNELGADDLAMQVARASAAGALT